MNKKFQTKSGVIALIFSIISVGILSLQLIAITDILVVLGISFLIVSFAFTILSFISREDVTKGFLSLLLILIGFYFWVYLLF